MAVHFAEAVKFAEQAIAIDPQSPWMRQALIETYLELEDPWRQSKRSRKQAERQPGLWLPIYLYGSELQRAAQIAFADPSHADGNSYYCDLLAYAARDQALASGELEKASKYIEGLLRKDARGQPLVYALQSESGPHARSAAPCHGRPRAREHARDCNARLE